MTLSAAFVTLAPTGPVLRADAPLPVAALVLGKSVTEAAELLPRLFNLCRVAQGKAARLALGLPDPGPDPVTETIRDHMLKLCVILPRSFGVEPVPIPGEARRLPGPQGLPGGLAGLERWDSPVAALARHIASVFPKGVAVTAVLPAPPPLAEGAFENSAAGRQAGHPLLQEVEAQFGRGPLWRYLGLVADLEAALERRLPEARLDDGVAVVSAARGAYALKVTEADGIVTGIVRRTPTEHMLASGGALMQALGSLPVALWPLAPQVVALHDPCIPVAVREAGHA